MERHVLISGGAGFIGSRLSLSLSKRGWMVTVLDNLEEQIHGKDPEWSYLYRSIINQENIKFIKGDVRNIGDWEKSIKGQDAVIHFAAETGTGQSMYQISRYIDVNVGGTARLIDAISKNKHKISKIILASSRAVYGEGRYHCQQHGEVYPSTRDEADLNNGIFDCKCPVCGEFAIPMATHEESILNHGSIYGISKWSQEQIFFVASRSLHIPVVIFRYQNVYGQRQSLSNPYTGVLSIFSTQIKKNHNVYIYEDGKMIRDFVFVDDVVNATILGLENETASNIYNVGTGQPVSILEIAEKLIDLYSPGKEVQITGNYRLGDIRNNYADVTKIKRDLHFQPLYSLENGLSEFAQWVNTRVIETDNYSKSIVELRQRGIFK